MYHRFLIIERGGTPTRITAAERDLSVNLASVRGATEDRVRAMLGRLRSGGWVASVIRGMTERRRHRFFLTSRARDLLYTNDHQHPSPRKEARATGLAAFHPGGELPADSQERFALDHDHPGRGDVPAPPGHAGAGLSPGPGPAAQRAGQPARRRRGPPPERSG